MKKTAFVLVLAVVLVSFLSYGCVNKTSAPSVPTPTPVTSSDLVIQAGIAQNNGLSTFNASVILRLDSTSAAVSGAAVTMNGHILTETGTTGYYSIADLPGAAGGVTVNLSITSASGNVTGSVTIPSTYSVVFGTITGGINSTFSASHS